MEPSDDLETVRSEDYANALDSFIGQVRGLSGLRAIGTFGHVRTPGISDIDVCLVVDDDRLASFRHALPAVIDSIPRGRYFFAHQAFILPRSLAHLRRILFIDHRIDALRCIHGDGDLFDHALEPTRASLILANVLWNSTVWRTVTMSDFHRSSLRSSLLFLQTVYNCGSVDLLLLGRGSESRHWLAQGRARRNSIVRADPARKPALLLEACRRSIEEWFCVQWQVHALWRSLVSASALGAQERMPNTGFSFAEAPEAGSARIVLPAMFRDAFTFFDACFSDRFDSAASIEMRMVFHEYRSALAEVFRWARTMNMDPHDLFLGGSYGIFPSPFNHFGSSVCAL